MRSARYARTMEWLPEELVLLVLERLSLAELLACARVSRSWRQLVASYAVHVRKRSHEPLVQAYHRVLLISARGVCPTNLLARTPYLRQLTVHARVLLTRFDFIALKNLQHLCHLDVFAAGRVLGTNVLPVALRLSSFVVNDTLAPNVLRLLASAKRLQSLQMYGHSRFYLQGELRMLLRARRLHITDLTLRCHELPNSAYLAIGNCTMLVSLRLYSCWLMTSKGASYVTRPALRTLHVTGARMLRPTVLHGFISELPPQLEELVLSAGWFGDEHVATLGARTPGLRVLELWRCKVSATGLQKLVTVLPLLQELDVDLLLDAADVRALTHLGRPQRLYCRLEKGASADRHRQGPPMLSQQRAGARMSRGAHRGQGEGWRAELYYSWSSAPRPRVGRKPSPVLDFEYCDTEDDYTLFGSDDDEGP